MTMTEKASRATSRRVVLRAVAKTEADLELTLEEKAAVKGFARFIVSCGVVGKPLAYLAVTFWGVISYWEEVWKWAQERLF